VHVLAQIYSIGYLEMDWGWPDSFGCLSVFEAASVCLGAHRFALLFAMVVWRLLTLATYLIGGHFGFNQSLV